MRKYQQLFLVIISILSVIILLIYRSENNRLKYVLEVVNFFGRNDATALDRLENQTTIVKYDFLTPMPVWQRIGKGIFAYSAFWEKYSVEAGGEVTTLVIALPQSLSSFQCGLKYPNGITQIGKFGFTRESVRHENNSSESFIVYRFICKVQKDFNKPVSIHFADNNFNSKHSLQVRNTYIKNLPHKLAITVCLHSSIDTNSLKSASQEFLNENHLLQYFLHHHLIGVDEFLIYDTGFMNERLAEILRKNQIRFSIFPFNFPFDTSNVNEIKQLIQMDCLHRTKNLVSHTLIAEPHEFLYAKSNLQSSTSPLKSLKQYSSKIHRFDLKSYLVCISSNQPRLVKNLFYKIDINNGIGSFSIFRNEYQLKVSAHAQLSKDEFFVHRYSSCDNKTELNDDWRATVELEFLRYIDLIDGKLKILLTAT